MARTRTPIAERDTAVGYLRVSTDGQAESGAGLTAQMTSIATDVERRGWQLVQTFTDEGLSGKSMASRPGLQAALAAVRRGDAATLVVSKLDRLSRSVLDFAVLAEQAQTEGWSIVVVDLGLDLGTAHGRLTATIMSGLAEWERSIISIRTKEALAAKKAAGVRLGRPQVLPQQVVDRIQAERQIGTSLAAIARHLTEEGVPTARGGSAWQVSTVHKLVASRQDEQ